jgi:hypothetical protein
MISSNIEDIRNEVPHIIENEITLDEAIYDCFTTKTNGSQMKFFKRSKDGGPDSPVDAFFIIEIKSLFTIAILRFNCGGREAFHTHAFNALTWFIWGDLVEEDINGEFYIYKRSIFPKITRRSKNHRVYAYSDSWCFTLRGPWSSTWTEDDTKYHTVLTHGRKIVERAER